MIFGILNRLATAAGADQEYRAEQEQDGKQSKFIRKHNPGSIGTSIKQVKRLARMIHEGSSRKRADA
jgi:hypothetical protein